MQIFLSGSTNLYNGPGTCGTGAPPPGASPCEVVSPQGQRSEGWCLPDPSASPSPATLPLTTPIPIVAPPVSPTIPAPGTVSPVPLTLASPTAALVVFPSSITLTAGIQPPEQATLTVIENAYFGSFSASVKNAGIVTISPTSGSGPFTVTAVAQGKTKITFSDSGGNSATTTIIIKK